MCGETFGLFREGVEMMKIIGLIGGSGAGKSTVSAEFQRRGAYSVDGDKVARDVVLPGEPALLEIVETFGEDVLCPDGTLNRKKLSEIVFSNPDKLHKLNLITHKYISEEIKRKLAQCENPIFIMDAAALVESGLHKLCDAVVFVNAEKETRIARIMARDGMSLTEAKRRIDAQKEDSFYRANSQFEIQNNGEPEALENAVSEIIKGVLGEEIS